MSAADMHALRAQLGALEARLQAERQVSDDLRAQRDALAAALRDIADPFAMPLGKPEAALAAARAIARKALS